MKRTTALRMEKWAIWIGLIAIVFLLRHLFPVFFLTFILAYMGNTAVNALTKRFPYRKLNAVLVYVAFLTMLVLVMVLVVPRMLNEARGLARQYIASEAAREAGDDDTFIQREAREIVDKLGVAIAGRETFDDFQRSDAYSTIIVRLQTAMAKTSRRVTGEVTEFANSAFVFASHFVLAIILSFVLIWDLPRTKQRLQRFAVGRTAEIYAEVAPSFAAFSTMLGRAFEAQTVIAIVNAILSVVVFLLLGLPSIALLAMIVFVCSYIPILGMILSTVPAALLALKLGGMPRVLWLVVGILVIHAIEAYMLNPLIYGRHLRLHPVAVLLVLIVAEHLFGVWGLLLGVPVAAFVLKYVIEGEPPGVPGERSPAPTVTNPHPG